MADPAWFGGRLKELREAAGLTQQQLADGAGCTWEAISRWERGRREPGWSQILALTEALGVSCEAFTQEPAEREPSGPGRPPKHADEPAPKKPAAGKKPKR